MGDGPRLDRYLSFFLRRLDDTWPNIPKKIAAYGRFHDILVKTMVLILNLLATTSLVKRSILIRNPAATTRLVYGPILLWINDICRLCTPSPARLFPRVGTFP